MVSNKRASNSRVSNETEAGNTVISCIGCSARERLVEVLERQLAEQRLQIKELHEKLLSMAPQAMEYWQRLEMSREARGRNTGVVASQNYVQEDMGIAAEYQHLFGGLGDGYNEKSGA